MNLPSEIFGDVVVVHAPDELGEEQAVSFLQFVLRQGRQQVVVDLDGVETLDSAGLVALLDTRDALRSSGGELRLIASNAVNRKILNMTRLDQQLEVFETVIEAVKSFA